MAVVRFPGSNCDLDAVQALRMIKGVNADLLWHEERSISDYDAVVLPGGFSFGDYLRGGAIAAKSPAMERVSKVASSGRPVLGICNGFQVLIEAGLLPGALLRNTSLRFVCRWVSVRVENTHTSFTRGLRKGQRLRLPIAHNEGRFYASPSILNRLKDEGQAVFRYCDEHGRVSDAANPTGTIDNIAGVCNREGNVMGLMPHPERASEPILSPDGSADGALLFESLIGWLNC
ncbi:MAG: phosphoribosylformylglycinamidine synthase I [Thaumarchaeota archaeon]|nr:phosphoribosylformylglycinamidine synthase I [Nitrososphaerota archaeon]